MTTSPSTQISAVASPACGTVYEVLDYLAFDMTEEEILEDFPDLTREDFKACITFAAEHEWRLAVVPLRREAAV